MSALMRRILLHGGLTALLLAVVGVMLAQLASIWLVGSPGTGQRFTAEFSATAGGGAAGKPEGVASGTAQAGPHAADEAVIGELRWRMPVFMAVWGFAFVAVGELVLWRWRNRRRPPTTEDSPSSDETEKLLEQLLRQAESQAAAHTVAPPVADGADTPQTPTNREATEPSRE